MLENVGIPLEIVDGFISSISVEVPWISLLRESCHIDLNGLELTFAPKHKPDAFHQGKHNCFMFLTFKIHYFYHLKHSL